MCERRETLYLLARSGPNPLRRFRRRYATGRSTPKSDGREGSTWVASMSIKTACSIPSPSTARPCGDSGRPTAKRLEPVRLNLDDIKSEMTEHPFCDVPVHHGHGICSCGAGTRLRTLPPVRSGQWRLPAGRPHGAPAAEQAECPTDIWTAGALVPFRVRLEPSAPTSVPRWRVWARTAGACDYRELALYERIYIKVPADCAGLLQVFVTPDVRPGHPGTTGDYRLKSWIEIRQPRHRGIGECVDNGQSHRLRPRRGGAVHRCGTVS